MLRFMYGEDRAVADFVATFARSLGGDIMRCKGIGIVDEEGKLIGGIVYFNYDPRAEIIEIGAAVTSRRAINRSIWKRMFEYPFIECGCQMVVARVRADDERVLAQLARLNFNLTLIPRMYGREADGVIGTLTDDQWLDSNLARRVYRDVKKEAA